jgi:hypothetical protein
MAADVVLSDVKARQPPLLRVVLAATVGNVSDWFDFLVYGYFAVTIAAVFFQAAIRPFRCSLRLVRSARLCCAAVGCGYDRRLY